MLKIKLHARRDLTPNRAKLLLVLITLFGAALRFSRLDFPTARTDEAFTYWRTCGSFNQLFDTLRLDAFVPLHYEFVWLLTKIFGHALWVYRMPGAIFGMLMPIAMYLFARTILNRRIAVIAAIIGMSSTYFSFYARDAKMYMPAWCLTTFATAFAFRFILTGRRMNWLKFVFFGIAAAGTHSLTLLPISIIPIAAIAIRGHHKIKRTALILLGLVAIGVGPLIYYQSFNRWFTTSGGLSGVPQATAEEPAHDNGLMWVKSFQNEYGTEGVLTQSLGAYLFGYEYPPFQPKPDPNTWGDYDAYNLYRICFWVLGIAAIAVLTIQVILKSKAHRGRLLWLGTVMIGVPLYGFYLRSFTSFTPPWELESPKFLIPVILLITLVLLRNSKRSLLWMIGGIAMITLTWAAAKFAYAHAQLRPDGSPAWNHLWMPRYAAFVIPMILVLLAAMLDRLPTRIFRWIAISGIVILNVAGSVAIMTCLTGWPDDQIARDAASTIGNDHRLVGGNIMRTGKMPLYPVITRCYNLAVESGWEMDPPSFRKGNQWPYLPGYQIEPMMSKMRLISLIPLFSTPRFPEKIDHVIFWMKYDPVQKPVWTMDGWKLVSQREYTVRVIWNWSANSYLQRSEYIRDRK